MDQEKIGTFLKELRKEKGLTQEKFAEEFNISNRTVSRWENGVNMPDIDLIIMISDYYGIDLRELLDGERKSEKMNKEVEETVLKAVDYTNEGTQRFTKKLNWLLLAGAILWFISDLIDHTSLNSIEFLSNASAFLSGGACGLIICGVIATSRYGKKLHDFKQRLLKRQS